MNENVRAMTDKQFENIREVLVWVKENEYSALYRDIPHVREVKSIENFRALPTTSVETLQKNAENLCHYPEDQARFLASEFDPKKLGTLFLVPQCVDEQWDTVVRELESVKPRAAFLSIPPFWQASPFFYYTCRAHTVPVSVGNPRSPNLSLQIIEGVAVEYAVVTPPVMHELREGLQEKEIRDSVKLWHVVSPLEPAPHLPTVAHDARVSIEYHVFPGVPIAYTSPQQHEEDASLCAPLPEYLYEFEGERCFITSLKKHAMPLVRFELPAQVEVERGAKNRFRFV